MIHYLYFVFVGSIAGFFMALFGIGGGAFIVPAIDAAFLSVPHLPHPPFQLIVIGSLLTIVLASIPRATNTFFQTTQIRSIIKSLILSALPFIVISSFISTKLSDNFLRIGFAVLIAIIGIWTLFGNPSRSLPQKNEVSTTPLYKLIFIGAISGISSALFGLGGATILMPLLTMWVKLPIKLCLDISILFVATTSSISLISLIYSWIHVYGTADIHPTQVAMIITLGVVAAFSQFIANKFLNKMNDNLRRMLLGVYLIILSAWVGYRIYF